MNSHITHYSSVKQNNDFILYHNRAKSSLSVSPIPHSSDKSPISELMKDFTKNHIMLSKEERLPLSCASSPKNFTAQSPKLVTLREFPEGVIEPKTLIQTEREKRHGDLEKENKELKSLLKSRDIKLAQFLKANEDIQKRLGEYKSREKLNNFQKIDVDALKEDLENCQAKIKDLEQERHNLMTERSSWLKTTEEIDQGLQKYTKYVLHYVNKTDSHNFINFCFEDRFSSEKSLLTLLQTKNYGIIALQAFKYLSDLLTRIGALQNPNQEQSQNKSPYTSERREPRNSEPSSICLSPLKESREGTPRDLVKEMLEGTKLFLDNFDRVNEVREIAATQSYKSPKNNTPGLKSNLKKSSTTAELHKKQTPPPSTSRNVRIDVTNSATKLALKKQLSPKQSVTPQPQRQGSQTPKAMSTVKPTYSKMHEKKDAIAEIRRWSEKDILQNQSGGKRLTLVERLDKEDKNKIESERVVLFSECASRRNSNHVRKEADSKAKVPKSDGRKSSNSTSNFSKLEARRDSHATSTTGIRSKNTSENQYSRRALEESDRRSPFSVKSILKNALEAKDTNIVEQRKYNSGEDFLDTLDSNIGLNKKRNREHLEIQIEATKKPRNLDEMNKEEYYSQKGCPSSEIFPKEKTSPKTSPKALVGSLNFASLRNSDLMNKDRDNAATTGTSHISKEKAHYETPAALSSDDRLLRVLNQSPLSIDAGDSSARWLAKDLSMFKNVPEPQPLDKLDPKISYDDLRIVHFDDETKLGSGKFIARAMSKQEATSKGHKEEKAERFVTFDGNDDLFTCGDKDNTPSKRTTPKANANSDQKNIFTSNAARVSFDVGNEKQSSRNQKPPQQNPEKAGQSAGTYMGTLDFNTSRSNYNHKEHQADGYSSARNRIFASEISNITHAEKSLCEEW